MTAPSATAQRVVPHPPVRRTVSLPRIPKIEPLKSDLFRLSLLALLVQTVSKFGVLGFINALRPALLLFVASCGFAMLKPKTLNKSALRHWISKLIIAQAILACLSAVFGISLGGSAYFIINNYWKTIAFALLLIVSLRGAADVRRTIKATVIAGIVLAFLSVFVVHVSKTSGTGAYDANDLGLIMVMTLPLVLLVIQTSKGAWRIFGFTGLVLMGGTIALSASRGAFVGMIAVGGALLLFLPGVSAMKRIVSLFAVVATMALFAPPDYWEKMQTILVNPKSDYNWDAGQGRRMLVKRGIGYMLSYPVFGLGIDNFGRAEATMSDFALAMQAQHKGYKWSAPHNSWVEAGAETGVAGLGLWIALIVGSSWGVWKLRRKVPKDWAKSKNEDQRFLYLATVYVPIAVLGFAVSGTFVSFAWSDQSYILPAIALGLDIAFAEQIRLAGLTRAAPVGTSRSVPQAAFGRPAAPRPRIANPRARPPAAATSPQRPD